MGGTAGSNRSKKLTVPLGAYENTGNTDKMYSLRDNTAVTYRINEYIHVKIEMYLFSFLLKQVFMTEVPPYFKV